MPHAASITYSLVGLDCLIYGLSLLMTIQRAGTLDMGGGLVGLFNLGAISSTVLERMGMSMSVLFSPGDLSQPWRLITAIFLHGSLIHIGFNMMALINIGPMVEELYGSARYFFIYVVTGIFGYVVSGVHGGSSVGASGSILGLVGVLIAVTGGRQSAGAKMIRGQLISWVISIAVLGYLFPVIDNYAHAGGFAAGYVLGKMLPDRLPADLAESRRANIMGWAAALVVAASFIFMLINYFATANPLG